MSAKISDRDIYLRAKHGVDMTTYQKERLAELLAETVDLAMILIDDGRDIPRLRELEAVIHGPKLVDSPVRTDCLDCPVG